MQATSSSARIPLAIVLFWTLSLALIAVSFVLVGPDNDRAVAPSDEVKVASLR